MALTPISFNKTKTSIFAKSASQDPNTVYFAQDDHRIYLDTIPYDQDSLVQVTYYELTQLVAGRLLIPGCFYRITDYNCTTTQEHTQSANHPFDIIVRADSVDTLNEDAWAALHEGDTYFKNDNLQAWKLKYSVKNDTNRFAWANNNWGQKEIQHKHSITFNGLINPVKDQAILDMANRQSIGGANYTWTVNSVTCHLNGFTTNLSSDARKFVKEDGEIWTSSKRLATPISASTSDVYMTIAVSRAGTLSIAVMARSTSGTETITIKNGSGAIILNSYDIVSNIDKKPITLPDGSTGYHTITVNLPSADTYTIDWVGSGSSKTPYFYGLIYDMGNPELPVVDHPDYFGTEDFLLYCTDTNHKHIQDYNENGVLFGTANPLVYTKYHYRHSTQGTSSASNALLLTIPHDCGTLKIYARSGSSSATRRIVLKQNGVQIFSQGLSDSSGQASSKGTIYPVYSVPLTDDADVDITFPDGNIGLYCLEFEWTETVEVVGGKGVVYYMKDEHNNEAPYDFKNIMFARWKTDGTTADKHPWMADHYFSHGDFDDEKYFYTFSGSTTGGDAGTQKDLSRQDACFVFNNTIAPCMHADLTAARMMLNNIVFLRYSSLDGDCFENVFGPGCYNMTLGLADCKQNTFGSDCGNIRAGHSFQCNSFGNSCQNHIYGEGCYGNSFGNYSGHIEFGHNCTYNRLGNFANGVYFGEFGYSNLVEDGCNYIYLGNSGVFNRFSIGAYLIRLGDGCGDNVIGEGCSMITFGDASGVKHHYWDIRVESGNNMILLNSTGTNRSENNTFRNIIIGKGVNDSGSWKAITNSELGQTYETRYVSNNSKTITI